MKSIILTIALFAYTSVGFAQSIAVADTMPTTPAPTPTQDPDSVISLFSSAYTNVPVDTWAASWSSAAFTDSVKIGDSYVKKYSSLDFVGVETIQNEIDASNMTYFHIDVWSPNTTQFGVKLVDFGADGAYQGGDDSEYQVNFQNPEQGKWISYDIPMSDFVNLTARQHIAQLIFVGQPTGASTIYIDNVYFYKKTGTSTPPKAPTTPAPTPTQDPANVISLFSSAYTNVPVDTWAASWSSAAFTDSVKVGDSYVKKYSSLDFVGIETIQNEIDASDMDHFHIDVWSPDFTQFSIKLVDFGADGAYQGGDDSEYQIDYPNPEQGKWISYDIPMSDFVNLTARQHIAQLIFVGQPTGANTIYVDNVYFYKATGTPIERTKELPNNYSLKQNYPNPFNPTTNISYTLPKAGKVKLDVFNIQGQKVATLVDGYMSAGSHLVTFNALHLASGIYTYRLVSGSFVQVKKMVLIK